MAWRPTEYLIEGELDNRNPGKVTGWMKFTDMKEKIVFDLEGNFHRDIRGAKIRLRGEGESADAVQAAKYMKDFSTLQKGKVGDMTAGLPPADYVEYPYFEWYSQDSGRCVIELEAEQIELLTQPIPACESDPITRKEQAENMAGFLCDLASDLGVPETSAIAVGETVAVEQAKKVVVNNKIRGMKLLTQQLRRKLPPLYSQEDKGGKAVVHLKMFTPDSNWIWLATEFDGEDTFFGLVDGLEKELGYFSLSELENVNGPMGLPIERDLYFQPKTLEEIAPEMFKDVEKGGD